MRPTGLKNQFTGEEIMEIERSDLDFSKEWDQLSLDEKANFCSFIKMPILNKITEPGIKDMWNDYKEMEEDIKARSL